MVGNVLQGFSYNNLIPSLFSNSAEPSKVQSVMKYKQMLQQALSLLLDNISAGCDEIKSQF